MTVLGVRVLVLFFFFKGGGWAEINLQRNVSGPYSSTGVSSITGLDPTPVPPHASAPFLKTKQKLAEGRILEVQHKMRFHKFFSFFPPNTSNISKFSANGIAIFFSVQPQPFSLLVT